MKKKTSSANRSMSLGELIMTVSSCSSSNRETVAAVSDLLDSGVVRLQSKGRKIRARVC